MCYSARVRQDLNTLIRKFGASVDWEGFELLFRRRLEDGSIKISRALEDNFEDPAPHAGRTREYIEQFRRAQASTWEQDLIKQKNREADLDSFAAVTDEPLPEIAATGHQRCITSLHPDNVDDWLEPDRTSKDRLEEILNARKTVIYEHRQVA